MGVFVKPAASSALRMAATRPSIMSLGATISAPARACDTAALASHSSVGSFCTSPSTTSPQWPWLVYSQLQTSVITSSLRHFALEGAHGLLHDAIVGISARRQFVFGLGNPEQNHAADSERVRLRALLDQTVDRELGSAPAWS